MEFNINNKSMSKNLKNTNADGENSYTSLERMLLFFVLLRTKLLKKLDTVSPLFVAPLNNDHLVLWIFVGNFVNYVARNLLVYTFSDINIKLVKFNKSNFLYSNKNII